MISKLKLLATAPTFPDPEKTRLAKLLNQILLAVIAIFSITTILTPFRPEPFKDIVFTLLATLLMIFIFIIMRLGHVKLACWLISISAYLAICLSIFVFGGVRSSYNSLIILVIITAILLGPKATIFMGLLSIFTGWLYLVAETQALFVPQLFYLSTSNIWFTQTVNLILATMLLGLSSHNLIQALNSTRKSEDALSQKNEALLANTQVLEEQETILRQVLAELSASNENYRTVFNATNEAIFIQEAATGRILDVNQAMLEMYGYPYEESLKASVVDLSAGTPPYSEIEALEYIKKASREGPQLFQWLAKRENGELFWVEVALKLTDIAGQSRALAVVRDITERKKQEADREALITKLEQKNDELERFTYTISHDLKSPLITINGFLGYFEQDVAAGNLDSVMADLAQIRNATSRMQQLLDELLELSRIGRLRNDIETVSFNAVVDEAIKAVSGQLVTRNIELDITPDMPFVTGDFPRLVAVVQNLIDNAIKFMGATNEPRIEIGCLANDAEPIFYVADNGIGIEPQYQDTVFELFERLNPDIKGTGLGLALAKRIVELHNGRFWLESEGLGKGSTFFFTIPNPTPNELNDSPYPDRQTEI